MSTPPAASVAGPRYRLVISDRVLLPDIFGDKLAPAAIRIDTTTGKIVSIETDSEAVAALRTGPPQSDVELIDAGRDIVMSGLVDSHVHCNEPGRTDWEGLETATRAAAAGGVTTIVDMPLNSIPPTTTAEGLKAKEEAAIGKLSVDLGLWGGIGKIRNDTDDERAGTQLGATETSADPLFLAFSLPLSVSSFESEGPEGPGRWWRVRLQMLHDRERRGRVSVRE